MHIQDHPLFLATLIALTLGCRRGEAIGLKWANVDLDANTVYIKTQVTRGGERKVKQKKPRLLELPGYLKRELISQKERQAESAAAEREKTNSKVSRIETYVCAVDGELPSFERFAEKLKNFQLANGLPTCRFHDLRHTYAEMQLANGTDIRSLQEALGHSKLSTTERYLHFNTSRSKKVANITDRIFLEKKKVKKPSFKIRSAN